jgi:hypothetical protein
MGLVDLGLVHSRHAKGTAIDEGDISLQGIMAISCLIQCTLYIGHGVMELTNELLLYTLPTLEKFQPRPR